MNSGVAENKRDAVDVAARPSDFNRVPDGAFDAARGGLKLRRIEHLGDGY